MIVTGLVIRTDGSNDYAEIDASDGYAYKTIAKTIGCKMIEVVAAIGCSMYLDEEGKFNGAAFNLIATELYGAHDDVIMGDVLLLGPPTMEGRDTSLPHEIAKIIESISIIMDISERTS